MGRIRTTYIKRMTKKLIADNPNKFSKDFKKNKEEKERAFRGMLGAFKKQCNEAGVLAQWKQKQFYESKGEKRRRKAKEMAANFKKEELKQKLRQHFG